MNHLKPYPAYKDSGLSWLGDTPEHWKVMPNRATFNEIKEKGYPDEEMLSVTITQGVIKQTSLLTDTSKKDSSNEDKSKYKLVCPGDIAYNKMRAWQGAVGASNYRGIVSPAYIVIRPRENQNPRFFHYIFRTPAFAKEAERWSYGISSDQWSLRPKEFKQIYSCVPSLPEQIAIVRYLDYIDRRIRRYINAKKKLIALLNEQKQAVIHQAMTRGLDPNVRFKPSGVEWLGDIPKHWEVRRLKSAFRKIVGGSTPSSTEPSYWDGDIVWVTPSDISHMEQITTSLRTISRLGLNSCSTELVPAGSLVLTSRAPVGNVSLACVELCTNQGCKALIPDNAIINSSFALEVLRVMKTEIQSLATGTTFTEISTTKLGTIAIPVPPLYEQTTILQFLNEATANISAATDRAQREIDLLREYRTRLIADVVTGKLDVREAAANLPVEAEGEPEEIDELTDSEGIPEEADLELSITESADEE